MSLFNRPVWAKSQTSNLDEDASETSLFSHSARSYSDIVAEKERKRRARLEKSKAREKRRGSGKREIKEERDGAGSPKKRRITLEDGEALLNSVGLARAPSPGLLGEDEDSAGDGMEHLPVRRSPRINTRVYIEDPRMAKKCNKSTEVVDTGSSDHEEDFVVNTAPLPPAEPAEEESDDEFAELARRARLQRQQKDAKDKKSRTPDVAVYSPSPGVCAADTGQRSLPTPLPDPTIQLFVTSRIPNTNPLIVHRKLSQRIQEIRQVWCTKQGFSEEFSKDVFFVHRMRRVYDVTTCRSLGLEVDSLGNVVMKGTEGKDGVEKVHLEAVTNELFEQLKAEKARETKRRSGDLPPEESAEAGAIDGEDETQHPRGESLIRLLLKAKGKEDFKLKVKPVSDPSGVREQLRPDACVDDTIFQDHNCL